MLAVELKSDINPTPFGPSNMATSLFLIRAIAMLRNCMPPKKLESFMMRE
jgi:hypothetical protein